MTSKERPVSIRVSSEDGENSENDLYKLLYIHKRLKSLGKHRTTIFRNLKKIKKQRQYLELYSREKPTLENLEYISHEFNVQLHIWDQARYGKCPELINTIISNHSFPIVNIVAPYFNEPNDYSLSELHLVLDLDRFKRKISHETQGNFWMCCEMSDFVGCEDWGQLPHAWKCESVDLTKELHFIAMFGFGFQIFLTRRNGGKNKKTDISFERIHKTRQPESAKYINLEYVGSVWPENKTVIELHDEFIIRPREYFRVLFCPNDFCDYNTNRQFNLDRHVKSCARDTIVNYKQSILTNYTIRDRCIKSGAILESFHPRHFACFDIESVGVKSNVSISDFTKLHSLQRVISVSITATFRNDNEKTKVILRNGMDEHSYRTFINAFMSHLMDLQSELQSLLPASLHDKIAEGYLALSEFKLGNRNYSLMQVKRIREEISFLERMRKLYVFGFNSQAYDLSVLFSGLLYYAKNHNYSFQVLKRGNHIMSLRIEKIVFADCLNFTSGCNLDSFGTMWGSSCAKAVFPYEKYSSIGEMNEDVSWPSMRDFKSSLKCNKYHYTLEEIKSFFRRVSNEIDVTERKFICMTRPDDSSCTMSELANISYPICLDTYVNMWLFYTRSINDGSMKSMADYLKYYNAIDTELLADAFTNYVESFITNFNLSPVGYVSLPGFAERVMWSMYSQEYNRPYSFSEKFGFVNKILRDNLMGGLSCVFKRHVEINSDVETFSTRVHRAANGQKFTKLMAFDANSEYILTFI